MPAQSAKRVLHGRTVSGEEQSLLLQALSSCQMPLVPFLQGEIRRLGDDIDSLARRRGSELEGTLERTCAASFAFQWEERKPREERGLARRGTRGREGAWDGAPSSETASISGYSSLISQLPGAYGGEREG